MTCIVGVVDGDHVLIGGDSAGVGGWDLTVRSDTKVFRVGPYVMGFTASFRMGQLLRYSLRPPEPSGWDVDRFMATAFIDSVRQCLKAGGYARAKDGGEQGGTFLVAIGGLLYVIYEDYQIGRSEDGYIAVGCGRDYALGALHATTIPRTEAHTRIEIALEAAAHHSAGVSGPFTIMSTPKPEAEPVYRPIAPFLGIQTVTRAQLGLDR
ncbi:MAG TPA: hypothetical protein VGL75_07395 [Acidothermaceae bacterium]